MWSGPHILLLKGGGSSSAYFSCVSCVTVYFFFLKKIRIEDTTSTGGNIDKKYCILKHRGTQEIPREVCPVYHCVLSQNEMRIALK
ncbi:MAG: hypothetical protein JWN75_1085 [Candidatus Saccharibacteria bacterium]|nr:hypothetical protein [Candidatus Saccharibacteria bacterium]